MRLNEACCAGDRTDQEVKPVWLVEIDGGGEPFNCQVEVNHGECRGEREYQLLQGWVPPITQFPAGSEGKHIYATAAYCTRQTYFGDNRYKYWRSFRVDLESGEKRSGRVDISSTGKRT